LDFFVGDPAFANEKPDYLLITNQVLPALRQEGVTQAQIEEMMIANPRRFLAGAEGAPDAAAVTGVSAPAG
jgi:predicted metal-dependent phosphotriesterase family hydrolase